MTNKEVESYGFKKWSIGFVLGAITGFVCGLVFLEINANTSLFREINAFDILISLVVLYICCSVCEMYKSIN